MKVNRLVHAARGLFTAGLCCNAAYRCAPLCLLGQGGASIWNMRFRTNLLEDAAEPPERGSFPELEMR